MIKIPISGNSLKFKRDSQSTKWFSWSNGHVLHEPPVTKEILRHLDEDSIFFDVGAYIGYFSVLATVFCSKGQVHAFEMDQELAQTVEKNLSLNDGAKTFVNEKAVSSASSRKVHYNCLEENKTTFSIKRKGNRKARTIALDDYQVTPDVMKIDVEGAESLVFHGAQQIIPDVGYIFLELHPFFLSDGDISLIEKSLSNYSVYKFSDHRSLSSSLEPVQSLFNIKSNSVIMAER